MYIKKYLTDLLNVSICKTFFKINLYNLYFSCNIYVYINAVEKSG